MATSYKKKRGEFDLSDQEYYSREMMFITYTMLESLGYSGITELASIIKDSNTMLRLIRFLNGTTIKLPSLGEFVKCLRAAIHTFCDMHKMINSRVAAKCGDIRQFMNITPEEEKELMEIFDNWAVYLGKNGLDPTTIMHCNRENTKKRIKMVQKGKKWTQSKY